MNRASRLCRGTRLALAVALVGVATATAFADMSLPPPKYDIGGETEADVLANYSSLFSNNAPPLYRVPYGEALAKCDEISLRRWGEPYPVTEYAGGVTVLGCLLRNDNNGDPEIVYSYRPDQPWLAGQLLRHEVGHLMGWSGAHERN